MPAIESYSFFGSKMPRVLEMTGTRYYETNESTVLHLLSHQPPFSWLTRPLGKLLPTHLSHILSTMVGKNVAAYEPSRQTRSVLLYWRLPEEWAEALHSWVCTLRAIVYRVRSIHAIQATSTGQLNTILTFYDITEPQVESPLLGLPIPLLRKAIAILSKTGRAQLFGVADGEGVRIFAGGK
jgi:ESCRT-II complex subunit VPS25